MQSKVNMAQNRPSQGELRPTFMSYIRRRPSESFVGSISLGMRASVIVVAYHRADRFTSCPCPTCVTPGTGMSLLSCLTSRLAPLLITSPSSSGLQSKNMIGIFLSSRERDQRKHAICSLTSASYFPRLQSIAVV